MFSKSKESLLYIPSILLYFAFITSFVLIFIYTQNTQESLYIALLQSEQFWNSFVYALEISLLSLCISLCVFLILYYLLFTLKFDFSKDIGLISFLFSIPVLLPYSFCALLFFLILFLFSSDEVFLLGYSWNIILSYVYKIVPFLLLVCIPNLMKLSKDEMNLHKIYSAKKSIFFWNILIFRNLKVLFISAFIIFCFIFNAYEIPSILGSSIQKVPAMFTYELLNEYSINSIQKAYASSLLYFVFTLLFAPFFYLFYLLCKKVFV